MERKPLKRTGMSRAKRGYWTCQRKRGGAKCGHVNPNRKQKCEKCEGKRWKRVTKKKKHMAVLQTMSYEDFVEVVGHETCEICGAPPRTRRLHRDHDHETGRPRGLLCFQCNSRITRRMNLAWTRLLLAYLERAEQRWRLEDEERA